MKVCDLDLDIEEKLILSLCWTDAVVDNLRYRTGFSSDKVKGILINLRKKGYILKGENVYGKKFYKLNREKVEL